mgnify:CR=1 FL=1
MVNLKQYSDLSESPFVQPLSRTLRDLVVVALIRSKDSRTNPEKVERRKIPIHFLAIEPRQVAFCANNRY